MFSVVFCVQFGQNPYTLLHAPLHACKGSMSIDKTRVFTDRNSFLTLLLTRSYTPLRAPGSLPYFENICFFDVLIKILFFLFMAVFLTVLVGRGGVGGSWGVVEGHWGGWGPVGGVAGVVGVSWVS